MRIRIASITPGSPAREAGLAEGDEISAIDGVTPRDVLDYARLAAEPGAVAELADGRCVPAGGLNGAMLADAVFDGVQTCDNHCAFCFIYQLPKGMRRSLYLKDDDYRLSAMYGNFTTLTRFTELDLERCVDEKLAPLHVSVHVTEPTVRAAMLRNPKGAVSLRWLRYLLDAGTTVHAQIVLCPDVNDGDRLDRTLADLLAGWSELASVGIVPLGISRFSTEDGLRMPTPAVARRTITSVTHWQDVALRRLGRRFVFASDELYLLAGEPFPSADAYEGFPQHENGIGMAAALAADSAPVPHRASAAPPWGYRAVRSDEASDAASGAAGDGGRRVAVVTGELGAPVVAPLLRELAGPFEDRLDVVTVRNDFFGGNIAVTGLLVGDDLCRAIAALDDDVVAVVPDVVFNEGRTLDDWTADDLRARTGREIVVVPTDADGLRRAADLCVPSTVRAT